MSKIEDHFAAQLKLVKIEGWVRQFYFHPVRKWHSDFCFIDHKLIIEVEGGIWKPKCRHTTGKGFTEDCVKYNEALLLGWNVLRVTSDQVRNGQALAWVERALKLNRC